MAETVKGINIQIGAETTAFKRGLSELNKESKNLQTELSAVNRGLKFDPANTTLLKQKQELLSKVIAETETKVNALKSAKEKADADMASGTEINEKQYRELEREIVKAEQSLSGLTTQQNKMNGILSEAESAVLAKSEADEKAAGKARELANAVDMSGKKIEFEKAELERSETALDKNASSQDRLKLKKESLNKQIDLQKQKISALEGELNILTSSENRNEKAITEKRTELVKAQTELNSYSKELKDAANDTEGFNAALGKIGGATKVFIGGVGGLAAAAVGVTESTREYREDMGKLEAAFETAGYSADQARDVYEDFYAVLGESDRSVEAVNHLAKMNLSQEELNDWTTIATGVWATFGDSLPIEGLTEAANETAKVAKVTGPLADALNWAGVSEDEFNEKLAAASTEQERQALITETLNGLYSDAAGKYREVNGEIISANEAQSELNDTMAEIGAEVEPILTAVKEVLADFVKLILDNKEVLITAIMGIGAALLVLNVAMIIQDASRAMKGLEASTMLVKTAQQLLNIEMLKNPFVLVASLLAGLVAAFITAYNTNEDFRKKVDEVFEKVKEIVTNSINAVKEKIKEFTDIGKNVIEGLWNGISDKVGWLKEKVSGVVDKIKGWFTGKDGFDTHSPSKWSAGIGSWVMDGLGNGFKNNAAATAAKTAVNNIKGVFADAAKASKLSLEEIQGSIKSLTDKLSDYGSLFSTSQNEEGGTEYQVNSLKDYIGVLDEYQGVIEELKSKGIDEGLLSEMNDMSIDDAIGYGQKLLEMDTASFEEYNTLWTEKQKKAGEIAESLYKSELELLSEDFNGKLDSELSVLKETTFGVGYDSIQSLIDGMNSQEVSAISAAKSLGGRIASALKAAKESDNDDADGSHANGLSYVPFDGYRAILHQGERVLTAAENKTYKTGNTTNNQGDINFYFDKFVSSNGSSTKDIMREAEFYKKSRALATGG